MEVLNFTISHQHASKSYVGKELGQIALKNQNSKDIFFFAAEQLQRGAYTQCIELCQYLSAMDSNMEGHCQYQMGMAHFFLGKYQEAVDSYLIAYRQGLPTDTIEEDIWEAYEMLYKETHDIAYIIQYMEYCPCGRYVKEANKVVSVHHFMDTI